MPSLPAVPLDYTVKPGAKLGPGLIFVTPFQLVPGVAASGPEIITTSGKVVWYDPLPGAQSASNFQVQRYNGKPVLTWWQGTSGNPAFGALSIGIGQGEDVIMNDHYKIIKILKSVDGIQPDTHEFYITPGGDALTTGYTDVHGVNLTSVGGSADGTVVDSRVRDVNIRTGKVLLDWSALAHVPVADSYAFPLMGASPWDFFHVNSISSAPDGNILVSARHTSALYEINPHTGAVVWTLGGKASSFKLGPGAQFAWQHDSRFISGDEIQLFDDEAGVPYKAVGPPSRALWVKLDYNTMTAALVKQIVEPFAQAETTSQGSVQTLANGNVLVGWGSTGTFSEYGARGRMLMYAAYPGGGTAVIHGQTIPNNWQTYRAFQDRWVGEPLGRPSISVTRAGGTDTVSVAWNGATQVRRWRLLAGPSRTTLRPVRSVSWSGLITRILTRGSRAAFVQVQGLAADGHVLRSSKVLALH